MGTYRHLHLGLHILLRMPLDKLQRGGLRYPNPMYGISEIIGLDRMRFELEVQVRYGMVYPRDISKVKSFQQIVKEADRPFKPNLKI